MGRKLLGHKLLGPTLLGHGLSRRSLIVGAGMAAVASPGLALSRVTTFDTKLERIVLPLVGLPSSLDGFRIAFATDLHVSENIPYDFLASSLKTLAAERVDLVVWGGDYVAVDGSTLARTGSQLAHLKFHERIPFDAQANELALQLGSLLKIRADAPSVAVRGNHEIWVAPDALSDAVRSSGTQLLINETTRISHAGNLVEIAGVDDFWNGVPKPPQFSPEAALKILVSHNPDYVQVLERNSLVNFDVALCGHTHAGQVCYPGLGPLTYNIESRFTEGLIPINRQAHAGEKIHPASAALAYTSRGLGVVELPFRLNCLPEVTVLTVRTAS